MPPLPVKLCASHFKDALVLSCGMDDQALEFFAWGCRSWVCGASNFLPEAHVALLDACVKQGDFQRGRQLMAQVLPVLARRWAVTRMWT